LSFNSKSGERDIIDGLHWYVRIRIKQQFPNIPVRIVAVKEWRDPLFTKANRKQLKDDKKTLEDCKLSSGYKSMSRTEKLQFAKDYAELILNCSIKYLTFKTLPENTQQEFSKISISNGRFDLSDSLCISKFGVK
jgi:hypothetical protein